MTVWLNSDGKPIVNADGKIIECDDCPCDTCDAPSPDAIAALVESRAASATLTVEAGDFADTHACCGGITRAYSVPFFDRPLSNQVRFQDTFLLSVCGDDVSLRVNLTVTFSNFFGALRATVRAKIFTITGSRVNCTWDGHGDGDDCTELMFQDWSLPDWVKPDPGSATCETRPSGPNSPVTVRINL